MQYSDGHELLEYMRMLTMYPLNRTVQSYVAPDGATRYLLADSNHSGYIGLEPQKPITWPGWVWNPNTGAPARVVTYTLEAMALHVETFATYAEDLAALEQMAADLAAEYANAVWYGPARQRVTDNPELHPYEDALLYTDWMIRSNNYGWEEQWEWVALEPNLDKIVQWGIKVQQLIDDAMAS